MPLSSSLFDFFSQLNEVTPAAKCLAYFIELKVGIVLVCFNLPMRHEKIYSLVPQPYAKELLEHKDPSKILTSKWYKYLKL